MDKLEKIDCRANGEVTFWAMSPLPSQGSKISDPVGQRIGSRGRRNGDTLSKHSILKNSELS